jgi:hypothetical protein
MQNNSIYGNQSWCKEMCLAHALEQGYTHSIARSFDDEQEALQFCKKVQKHWRTDASGLTKMHRRVYGFTVAEQWQYVDCMGMHIVLVLISAGSDFAALLSTQEIALVQPLNSTLIKPRYASQSYIDDLAFGSELSLQGAKQ